MAWYREDRLGLAWLGRDELLGLLSNNPRLFTWTRKAVARFVVLRPGMVRIGFGGLPNNNPPLNHNKGE